VLMSRHLMLKFVLGPSMMVRKTILNLVRVHSIPTVWRIQARLIVKTDQLQAYLTHSLCRLDLNLVSFFKELFWKEASGTEDS